MKKLILVFMLISLSASPVFAVGGDKYSHFGTGAAWSFVFDTGFYHLAENMGPVSRSLTSFDISMVLETAIEVGDEFMTHNSFSWDDIGADALGAFTGVLAAELINGQLWISASGRQIRLIGRW